MVKIFQLQRFRFEEIFARWLYKQIAIFKCLERDIYIYRERKKDRMKENERVRMYGIFKNFVKKLYACVVTIETSF